MNKLIEWLDSEHWTTKALNSFCRGLRLTFGALHLLFLAGVWVGPLFYWLYMMIANPWYLLNPFAWLLLLVFAFLATIFALAIFGHR